MDWDAEVESPATIAIIGAGPVGLEAAIYARFLGYFVEIFDAGRPVRNLKCLGDLLVQQSFRHCTSTLGRAAIEAQTGSRPSFPLDSRPSYDELSEQYYLPLAKTDLLFEHIHILSKVVSISRFRDWKSPQDLQDRCNDEFRVVAYSKNRGYWSSRVDVVLDCTGLHAGPLALGPGGGMAIGELEHADAVVPSLRYIDRCKDLSRVVVVGNSDRVWSILAQLSKEQREIGRLTWLVQNAPANAPRGTFAGWIQEKYPQVVPIPCRGIESMAWDGASWSLVINTEDGQSADLVCSTLIATSRESPEWNFASPLLPVWEPANVDEKDWPGARLATQEPNYYVLGSKHRDGIAASEKWDYIQPQIRDLFALLGARKELNLYSTFQENI